MTPPRIISIEGNIGSGKSTLLRHITDVFKREGLDVVLLQEPVGAWEEIKDKKGMTMLEKFYKDQTRYAFSFQMMAYISRLALLKDAVDKHPGAVIITERSLYTDKYVFAKMLYDTKYIEEAEYSIYKKWFDTFACDYPISHVVYVKADSPVCLGRIMRRSRNGESVISIDYLVRCNKYHDEMINNHYKDNALVLDGNNEFEDVKHQWVAEIKKILV